MNNLIQTWARGMYDIFTNAKKENVMNEIDMLLESLGLEHNRKIEHWTDKL